MVRSTSPEFATRVSRLLRSFPLCSDSARDADVTLSLVVPPPARTHTIRPFHFLYCDGYRAGRTVSQWHLFRLLECQLDLLLAEEVDRPLLLHAGGVARDGSGIILPGPSGSGKSSLTLALLQSGCRYYSDEIVAIDPEAGALHSFPKPLSIKNKAIFPHLAQRRDLWFGPDAPDSKGPEAVWYIHPEDLDLEVAAGPVPIQYIIFPSRGSDGDAQLTPLAPGEALKELVANSINFSRLGSRGFHLLASLAQEAQCFSLKSDNLPASVALVNRLMETQD